MLHSPRCSGLACAAVAAALLAASDPAVAAGQRSFVSTSGVDNPSCSLGAPCRSFDAAVAATGANGEIVVLDSGGYGAVTIAQSMSIIAPPGVYAGISVFSGNGVTVATPSHADRVVLVGLTINSQGTTGHGIAFTGVGRLEVARTRISGFAYGSALHFAPAFADGQLRAVDVAVRSSYHGIRIIGGSTPSAIVRAALERVDASDNVTGFLGSDTAHIVAIDSSFTLNGPNGIVTDAMAGTVMLMTCERCSVSGNSFGVAARGAGATYVAYTGSTIANNGGVGLSISAGPVARLAGTTIAHNSFGIDATGGLVQSQGNNFIFGNGSDGVVPIVVGSK